MRRFLIVLAAITMAGTAPAPAQEAEIETVIREQLDAFLAEDVDTAFEYASPSIRNMFRTPGNFGAMVRNGYPMVWRPGEVRFGLLEDRDDGLWQRVYITDAAGTGHALEYQMTEVEGHWRISGVRMLDLAAVSA
ncbi:DUF4864 domain-containing protein [Allosediminivita pacifica]|uniref:Uncharacterized protein DUF4864 n=1 Tax=Allosediminivita pacifica TaxID=1267769 RepID=A0A2T6AZM1_9RHOB|nr:DUF4864 domain-containing protein [Allosediminivita pacifica]PTX49257.1 uncharacterized protein DUF4864 [Allosediminivita pacifica]GGB05496.1 hypothetical protein GCM10011324_14520 [Allosediminivita pacifica]